MKRNIFKRKFIKLFRLNYEATHGEAVAMLVLVLKHAKKHGYCFEAYLQRVEEYDLPFRELATIEGYSFESKKEFMDFGDFGVRNYFHYYIMYKDGKVIWGIITEVTPLSSRTLTTPPNQLFDADEYQLWLDMEYGIL